MVVEFLYPANEELDEAYEYYEKQQPGLGLRFIDSVQYVTSMIVSYPEAWQPFSHNTRRCLVKYFPYGVIYRLTPGKVLIVAVANLHRKPDYWVKRLR